MTKTPEQMAEEWALGTFKEPYLELMSEDQYAYSVAVDAYLAGYKAAQDHFADASKVMTDHNADASKMVWISVKDRLPQIDTPVMLYTGHEYEIGRLEEDGEFSIWVDYRYGGEMAADQFTHWMPLPEPPKP
jgi:hypothetical protein